MVNVPRVVNVKLRSRAVTPVEARRTGQRLRRLSRDHIASLLAAAFEVALRCRTIVKQCLLAILEFLVVPKKVGALLVKGLLLESFQVA